MKTLSLPAPAKLNLSLRILGRREDGFHELDTLMVRLPDLADQLHFEPTGNFSFDCNDPSIPAGGSNLVVKAVRAFEAATGSECRHHISLEKSIPHGAGLGGGSSDAASTLLGLNRLHKTPLNAAELSKLAASLGSDIPFFLTSGAARCTGRGEIIEEVAAPPALPVLLLKPGFAVATPEAYSRFAEAIPLPGVSHAAQDLDGIEVVNDLEAAVFGKHRFLAELKLWLLERKEVRVALMSGSGSTLFAVLHHLSDAPALAAAARLELDPELWSWHGYTGS
jgi:4-diphosphocytidyl-2-C-methyl-D-erythritol kinase